ncbi:hypothetical protein E3N88_03013 [Mikania micrantha]|uniref:RING-type domain-containing protein n=1 Tax=Mikania micrantha TaxID=192012 RepID=A0A5N6Q7Y2_9ASTR|nr:hypothetical protein E3N88_03013 [Mikania micrantha]
MNTTINAGDPDYTTADTGDAGATVPYGLGFFFVIIFILITLCYGSYIYKNGGRRSRPQPPPPPPPLATTNHQHIIRISQGLDDEVIATFQTFVYSEAMIMPQKGDTPTCDANNSGCTICLADYKPTDVVRLLPECGHLFHVSCIDPWLKLHPTCPVCRNSPLHTV